MLAALCEVAAVSSSTYSASTSQSRTSISSNHGPVAAELFSADARIAFKAAFKVYVASCESSVFLCTAS